MERKLEANVMNKIHNFQNTFLNSPFLKRISLILNSAALVSALLLYGLLFCFIAINYLQLPWRREYTIAFYVVVMMLAILQLTKPNNFRFVLTRIDILFAAFLIIVLVSAVNNWWEGAAKYVFQIPIFFILPYLLGRIMSDDDLVKFWVILLIMGAILLSLMPIEYSKLYLPYPNWSNAFIFRLSHGVMLCGLIFSAVFLVIITILLIRGNNKLSPIGTIHRVLDFGLLIFLSAVVVAVTWMAARGSSIAAVISAIFLFALSPSGVVRRKILVCLVCGASIALAIGNQYFNKNNINFYNSIIQKPPLVVTQSFESSSSERLENINGSQSPILGEQACLLIKDSISDRWIHYQTALASFISHPYFGVGATRYGHYSCRGPGSFPHSTVLQAMSELGILGAIVYITLLMLACKRFFTRYFLSEVSLVKGISMWLIAYMSLQFITNQMYGNYFVSAGMYLVLGIASRFEIDLHS
jgi:hypothetical protein